MFFPALLSSLAFASAVSVAPLHHDVRVRLSPNDGTLDVTDTLSFLSPTTSPVLLLHAGLGLAAEGCTIASTTRQAGFSVPVERIALTCKGAVTSLTLRYRGVIQHAPAQVKTEHQRSFEETPGTIEARGVYLSSQALWLPRDAGQPDALVTARVAFEGLPQGWSALTEGSSVGAAGGDATYDIHTPTDDVHVIAGPFALVARERVGQAGRVEAWVWLREKDEALAARYIEVTGQYLTMYEQMLGEYPYDKFALVENFWETGYGMPSFTLLGSQVIRFPFILHTSYPHELLHNWWGNSVYVDPSSGNFTEGLTAYLADHLHAEQQGQGAEHRRAILEKFRDHVTAVLDFPLVQFQSRDSPATEAVGYGKAAMLFHMVRRYVGDERFIVALRTLYNRYRFKRAGFDQVEAVFGEVLGADVAAFFHTYAHQKGAPRLVLREVRDTRRGDGARQVEVRLSQTQNGPLFPVRVPVVVTTTTGIRTGIAAFASAQGAAVVALEPSDGAVLRVDVDPYFDVWRILAPAETPPALSSALGATSATFVLPSLTSDADVPAWQSLAQTLCASGASCRVVKDTELSALPSAGAVWVLGYGNLLRGVASAVNGFGAQFDDRGFVGPQGQKATPDDTALVVALDNPAAAGREQPSTVVFVGAYGPAVIGALGRKIPHYGKYGFLGFDRKSASVDNTLKGQWQRAASPMSFVASRLAKAVGKERTSALAALPPPFSPRRMQDVVAFLTAKEQGGRRHPSKGALAAVDHVEAQLRATGLLTTRQCATEWGCNLVAHLPGQNAALAPVVLGAHLDHLGRDRAGVYVGADDNASGVAVALEVALSLSKNGPLPRAVDVVFFAGEEQGLLGSRAYVKAQARPAFAMLNLDGVGRRQGRPFLLLDGDTASEWVHIARGVGFTTGIAIELAKVGGGASDQRAFFEAGTPAVQLFSGPHADYHRTSDTPDKIEGDSLVAAAVVAREIVTYLAERQDPLSFAGSSAGATVGGERKASLGTVPDMTFTGPGVRLAGTTPGSAAAGAGLLAGDVLLAIDGATIDDLRTLSDALKAQKPGDKVRVKVQRGTQQLEFAVTLQARAH